MKEPFQEQTSRKLSCCEMRLDARDEIGYDERFRRRPKWMGPLARVKGELKMKEVEVNLYWSHVGKRKKTFHELSDLEESCLHILRAQVSWARGRTGKLGHCVTSSVAFETGGRLNVARKPQPISPNCAEVWAVNYLNVKVERGDVKLFEDVHCHGDRCHSCQLTSSTLSGDWIQLKKTEGGGDFWNHSWPLRFNLVYKYCYQLS